MEEKPKKLGKNKGHANLIPAKKGEVRNPNGRPKGQRDYATIYREAMQILADKNASTPEKLEAEMVANGAVLARKGDYRFYKDFLDRLHGTPVNRNEHTHQNPDGSNIFSEKTDAELAKIAGRS